jgi:general secretion pathway protein A
MRYRILPRSLRPDSVRMWRGVVLAGVLALAALGAWALLLHTESRRQARREAGRSAAVVAQSIAREQERLVDGAQQLLLALSQRSEIVTVNPGACAAVLGGVLEAVPGYLDLVAARPTGEVICSARGALRLPAGADAADVRRVAESGNPALGRAGIDVTARRATVALSRPVIDDAGTVRAVLVAAIDLGQLERAVVESPRPPGAAMMLIDGNGVILSHHPQPGRWTGELLDEPLKPLLASQGAGLIDTAWLDGVPSLVLFEPLSRDTARAWDTTIVIALPRRAVFRDADRLFAFELAGLGLLALAGLVCGALLMDRLVGRPAQGLLRVIRSLNSGDVRARMRRGDERAGLVGRLARSVNALGRRLEEHQQTAQHLEEQLRAERTARLLGTPAPSPAASTPGEPTADEETPSYQAPPEAMVGALEAMPDASAGVAAAPAADGAEDHGWGLREPPFENAPNPRFLWLSPTHSDALVRLTYALRQRRGCAVLTGEPGCGKTLLTRAVVQRLEASHYEIGLLTSPHGGRVDLLRQVLYELGVDTADTTRTELRRTLNDLIVGNLQRGRETLIIVDDAQQVDDPAWFEELSSLLNIQTNERTLVTLLLAGTPELTAAIQRVQHLDRRVSIRCTLRPLSSEQTAQYIRYRLTVAGAETSMFTREAVTLIHQASGGVPRAINDVCDSGLLLARLDGLTSIDGTVMRRVLSTTPTAPDAAEFPQNR